ncbi:MAG: ribosome silencing factor [Candidatus Riflebacteria bacterium]|nr:ribosome silencing factor [Candidatus Riflebacteria bacterium]
MKKKSSSHLPEKLEKILHLLDDRKVEQLLVLDVRPLVVYTDYLIIGTGNNTPHVRSMADAIAEVLKIRGLKGVHIEGYQEATWVLIDGEEFVIHLFQPQPRKYYALEDLWADAARVRLPWESHAADAKGETSSTADAEEKKDDDTIVKKTKTVSKSESTPSKVVHKKPVVSKTTAAVEKTGKSKPAKYVKAAKASKATKAGKAVKAAKTGAAGRSEQMMPDQSGRPIKKSKARGVAASSFGKRKPGRTSTGVKKSSGV